MANKQKPRQLFLAIKSIAVLDPSLMPTHRCYKSITSHSNLLLKRLFGLDVEKSDNCCFAVSCLKIRIPFKDNPLNLTLFSYLTVVNSMVGYRSQTVPCNWNRFRCITSSIFNEKIQFIVKPSVVGAVMAPQLSVGVHIFVFVGVLKGPNDHPDTICLRRWCVAVFIQDLSCSLVCH